MEGRNSHNDSPVKLSPIRTQLIVLSPAGLTGGNQRLQSRKLGLTVFQLLPKNLNKDEHQNEFGGSSKVLSFKMFCYRKENL